MNLTTIIIICIVLAIIIFIVICIVKPKFLFFQKSNFIQHQKPISKGILCFSGGGFRAVSISTGVIHGVNKRLPLDKFLNRFSIIGSNSGGAWFVNLMCYSKLFYKMLSSGVIDDFSTDCRGISTIQESDKWKLKCSFYGMNTLNNMCACPLGTK